MKKTLKEKNAILHPQKTPTGASAPSPSSSVGICGDAPETPGQLQDGQEMAPWTLKSLETNSMCQLKKLSKPETSGRMLSGETVGGLGQPTK